MSLLGSAAKWVLREVVGAATTAAVQSIATDVGSHVGNAIGEIIGKRINPAYYESDDDTATDEAEVETNEPADETPVVP